MSRVFVVWLEDYEDRMYEGAFGTLAEAKVFAESIDKRDHQLVIEVYTVGSPTEERIYWNEYTMPLPGMWSDTPGIKHEAARRAR